jgi:YD repeat-containing protein
VSTATGSLAFAVTDLELGGAMPILFQRVYDSARRDEDSGLGAGWSFVFDDRVSVDGDSATLTTGVGARLAFRRSGQGQHFVLRDDEPGAHQAFDLAGDATINEQAAGLTRTYKKIGATFRLARIADPNNNAINIAFNTRGNVASITSGAGAIALEWSDAKDSRLLSAADSAGRRVAFKQDGQRLRTVTDPAGAQWTYGYAAARLIEAADPLGRVMLRARYDKAGRAVESGDAAGVNSFEYESSSSAVSRRTLVADPLGATTLITHTDSGALASVSDGEGQSLAIEYNAANRSVRVADSLGNETKFTYDQSQRLIRQSSADGTEKSLSYDGRGRLTMTSEGATRTEYVRDERGNVIATRSSDPGRGYDAKYNARGQVASLVSKRGRTVSFEYDSGGNETSFTYSDVGRFEQEYEAGRKIGERLPSGLARRYGYDARGDLAHESDNRGRSVKVERDASGAVSGLVAGNGDWVRAARDGAGRITRLSASNGKARHFSYDARGALTGYTDARGKQYGFDYDRRGRLRGVIDSEGAALRYDYGRAGKLASVSRLGMSAADSFLTLPASYAPAAATARAPAQGVDCLFDDDAFGIDLSGFGSDPYGCDDPFGGFETIGGGGGGEVLGGGGGSL